MNTKSPIISVIMGTYNCKNIDLLRASINSILMQTFQRLELIICDDGSTNATFRILEDIGRSDRRIKIIGYKRNRGLAYALNRCIEEACGKFIARQDDDDISERNRLGIQYEFLLKNPEISFVGSSAVVFDEKGIWGKYNVPNNPVRQDFLWNSPFLHPSVMFKREDLINIGGI